MSHESERQRFTEGTVEGTHIYFHPVPLDPKKKTRRWWVCNKYVNFDVLADIAWFSRWRKYAMYPAPESVFEEVCLREIADFCEARTKEHREAARAKCLKTQGNANNEPARR